jgi:hypothetical protein
MFDDETEDVGSDVEAYCPKCKGDTAHTVISKYEDEVRKVQCSVCGDVHTYRKPRGEADEENPEPIAAKKRALLKKPTWAEARERAGNKGMAQQRPYSIRDTYTEGDVVTHPKFGLGFATEITENKVEITFEDERRVLIHNRPDLAAQMPAIASMPAPRLGKGKKGKKSSAPPPPPVPAGKGAPINKAAKAQAAQAVANAAAAVKAEAKAAKLALKLAEKAAEAKAAKAAIKAAKASPVKAVRPAVKAAAKAVVRPAGKKPVAKPAAKKALKPAPKAKKKKK